MRDIDGERVLARVFFDEGDTWDGKGLVDALPERLRSEGFAGCTTFRSILGFGHRRRLHADHVEVSPPHGIVVEVVDDDARIERLLAILDEMLPDGMVTIERARVIRVRAGTAPPAPSPG